MKKILGRKQNSKNETWLEAVRNIERLVLKEELEQLETITLEEILKVTAEKNAAYAWSGGKDSIVLGDLCQRAGVKNCILAVCNMEYPAFMEWIEKHKPYNLEMINTGLDLDWLLDHPEALFPPLGFRWSPYIQIKAQNQYYREKRLDMILLGRRKADGNYVGKRTNIYTDSAGRTKYNPLADWTHEAILAYIHYHALELPPVYSWKDGYHMGTHPWFARVPEGGPQNGWAELYEIDPSVVHYAATRIPSAADFLQIGGAAK